ncbi:radical SAM/SPASM domain-containing protein [Anaerocolumna sp. MB42-C2]|uniref:radical SAM/SPASM domain-containing protein n=1 Tax=Anaerocolumna sp. MB42-C2 TaxID=3070997 RepID=UPI0027E09F34|nr:radical SAM protein [Anaerocolumna sp. MB42-C2]WMJ90745.1 radical SAM protein [Anaerocolumna sp. MB42-C2]
MILSHQCQMNCCFCSQGGAKQETMELALARRIMEELKENGVGQIGFTGGEPLLYPNFEEIILYGAKLGFAMSLITNGLLLDKYTKSSVFDHLKVIGVSLHGKEETHDKITGLQGSYRVVKENLFRFREKYPANKLSLNFTYCNLNDAPDELESVIALAEKLNASVNVARINEKGLSQNKDFSSDINAMLKHIDNYRRNDVPIHVINCIPHCVVNEEFRYLVHGCSAGISFCAIDSDGKVKLCPTADFMLGDLTTTSFMDVWNSPRMNEFRNLGWLPLKCKVCKEILKCFGACKIDGDVGKWPSFQDSLARKYLDDEWKMLASKRLLLKTNSVRSEGDSYIFMCEPLRFCSEEAVNIVTKMDGTMTGNDIIRLFSNDDYEKERIKEFILALNADKMIYTV